jgi:perosamine synthetase
MTGTMIKVSQGSIGDAEAEAMRGVFAEGRFGHTHVTVQFENALAAFLGASNVVAVNTGTSALHLALDSLGVGPGDEVILPSLTFVGAFQSVMATGARPISCEIDPLTLCADLKDVKKRITLRTKAIMPMHYAGQPCDMAGFLNLKEKTGIRIVEDAAHAFGGSYRGELIGSFGDVTCFSFDSIKNITCGEGGAVVCGDAALAENMRVKRKLGVRPTGEPPPKDRLGFSVERSGFRYHMGSLNAAIGLVQLKRFPEFASRRRFICRRYVEALHNLPSIGIIPTDYLVTVPHIFVIRVKNGKRNELMEYLWSRGIETGVNYVPNHFHEFFKSGYPLPVTEALFQEILTLPLHCKMTDEDTDHVIAEIAHFLR